MSVLCCGCMRTKEQRPVCEHCGYDENRKNASHQLPVGSVLRDQYLIGRVLGQGGFGITYLGWDQNLSMPIAVKEYYPNGLVYRESTSSLTVFSSVSEASGQFRRNRERFLQEARTLAKLREVPGIVGIQDFFQENDTAYIVMEYLQGINLREYTRQRGGRIPAAEVLSLLKPVIQSLEHVHREGLVHRDISPDNIMLLHNGTVKLLDFGAVREVADADTEKNLSQSTEAILKHGFAPIEQYQKRGSLGPWTDVYALCCTAYYMLMGKVPPDAPERILGEAEFDWTLVPGLSPEQAAAFSKGTALLPKDRITSMHDLYQTVFRQETEAEQKRLAHRQQEAELPRWQEQAQLEKEKQAQERLLREKARQQRHAAELIAQEEARKQRDAEQLAREEEARKRRDAERLAREEETRKRREVEQLAQEEARKRREVEQLAQEEARKRHEAEQLAQEEARKRHEAEQLAQEEARKRREAERLAREEEARKRREAERLAREEQAQKLRDREAVRQANSQQTRQKTGTATAGRKPRLIPLAMAAAVIAGSLFLWRSGLLSWPDPSEPAVRPTLPSAETVPQSTQASTEPSLPESTVPSPAESTPVPVATVPPVTNPSISEPEITEQHAPNMLRSTAHDTDGSLWGNDQFRRSGITQITFTADLSDLPADTWDVSAAGDGTVLAL